MALTYKRISVNDECHFNDRSGSTLHFATLGFLKFMFLTIMPVLMSTKICGKMLMIVALLTSASALPAHVLRQNNRVPIANDTSTSISWTPCSFKLPAASSLLCASFSVPVDWDTPNGEHFDLGLVKLPAAASNDSFEKVGTLFINPGGPGGSASKLVAALALGAIDSDVFLGSFDIIGLDPRGVGLSSQVQCNMSIYAERITLFPQTEGQLSMLRDKNRRFGESCRNLTGKVFEHLDTISAAKDHEAVRVALGNKPMNFAGMSYGSQLGAQYAALFPENIRTLVLDGILQHSQGEAANLFIEASSYELGLSHFFTWASTNESSVLKGQDVTSLWSELLKNASTVPIPALSCNNTDCRSNVNDEEILFNAHAYLTFAGKDIGLGGSWEFLASALSNASQGDATALSTRFTDPTAASFLAIGCLDWTYNTSSSLPNILAQERMAKDYAPMTRGASQMWMLQHACVGWPAKNVNPPKKLNVKTNATILMTQSTADPSTGLPWALGMLDEIENKVLVLREGDGHTSLPLGGKTTEVIVEYLVTGNVPPAGLVLDS